MIVNKWSDVTVSIFMTILEIKANAIDEDDYVLNLVSYIYEIEIEELLELDYDVIINYFNSINYLNFENKLSSNKMVIIDDNEFHNINLNTLTFGEFIDLENLIKEGIETNLSTILTILFRLEESPANPLFLNKLEPYGDWIFHRAKLFDNVQLILVYGAFQAYIAFRSNLFKVFEGLFIIDDREDGDGNYEEETLQERNARLKNEVIESKIEKWGWDSMVVRLAGGDVTKVNEVMGLSVIQAFNHLSIKKELNIN